MSHSIRITWHENLTSCCFFFHFSRFSLPPSPSSLPHPTGFLHHTNIIPPSARWRQGREGDRGIPNGSRGGASPGSHLISHLSSPLIWKRISDKTGRQKEQTTDMDMDFTYISSHNHSSHPSPSSPLPSPAQQQCSQGSPPGSPLPHTKAVVRSGSVPSSPLPSTTTTT